MSFVIREQCGCGAAIEVEGHDDNASNIFCADLVNAWRTSHHHMSRPPEPRGSDHVGVDSLVEATIGFQRGRGVEVADG